MAEPVSPVLPDTPFRDNETVLGAGDTNAMPLPVYRTPQGCLSRWKLTDKEVAWILQHRCIYIHVATISHPPILPIAEAVGTTIEGMVCTIAHDVEDPLERLIQIVDPRKDKAGEGG